MEALDAVLLVPLTLTETVIGGFALGARRSGRYFNGDDLELLCTLAAQSAVAIQNARSYRALQTANEDLEAKVLGRTAELRNSNAELGRAYEGLQAAQAQLLTTEKMASLGLIVAGVAHEINNPLSFIIGNVDPLHQTLTLLSDYAARHDDPELAREIDRLTKILNLMALGAERTAAIVQDLRTFSRLGEAQPRPTDLHDAIEVSLRLLRPRWANRITIHRDYGPVSPVDVIPGQMNQVFMNVLANACDAIKGQGNLWIRTRAEDAHVTVAIRDDGHGIPPEHVTRVFDPFFTTKPIGSGTGLGLAITHGIVSHHGGTIRVHTEPGRGTEFQIVLPMDELRPADTEAAPARSSRRIAGA
jgi:signal transduction histidine kinase